MKKIRKTYSFLQMASAMFMILALLWLTISTPFVYAGQQKLAKQNKMANASTPMPGNDEEAANPFGNTTEEKAPSNSSLSEEYMHDHHTTDYFFSVLSTSYKCENADTYLAFHGELDVPPPNIA